MASARAWRGSCSTASARRKGSSRLVKKTWVRPESRARQPATSVNSTILRRSSVNCANCRGSARASSDGPIRTTQPICAISPTPRLTSSFAGTIAANDMKCVAVVGARTASEAGRRMAHGIGFELAVKDFTIVSGLARGVDSQAHQGALDANGRTVAVMGCGVDIIYPTGEPQTRRRHNRKRRRTHLGTSARHAADRRKFSHAQPVDLGSVSGRRDRRSGRKKRLAYYRPDGAGTGSPGLRCSRQPLDRQDARQQSSNKGWRAPGGMRRGCHRGIDASTRQPHPRPPQSRMRIMLLVRARGLLKKPSNQSLMKLKQFYTVLKMQTSLHVDSIIEESRLSTQTVLKLLLDLELRGLVTQHPGKLFSLG